MAVRTSPFVTSTGLVVRTLNESVTAIRSSIEASLGVSIDWTSHTLASHLVNVIGQVEADHMGLAAALWDMADPAAATGVHLDNLLAMVGLSRQAATASTVTVTLTATKITTIYQGDLVQGGGADGKAQWSISETTVIDPSVSSTADVVATCTTKGVIRASAGDITTIATPRDGWSAVTNAADATPGKDEETDAEARLRRKASFQASGSTTPGALRARLLQVDGVEYAVVFSNVKSYAQTIEGLLLPPKSIAIVLYPSTLTTAQQTSVAETIFDHSVAGIEQVGAQTATVYDAESVGQVVQWGYATASSQNITSALTLASGVTLAEVTEEVEAALAAIFETKAPGDDLYTLEIQAAIASVDGVLGSNLTTPSADVTINASQVATLGTVTLT